MADDGSGNFSLPSAAFVAGTTATASTVNANFSDIATALTARVTRNGSGSMSGNLAMGTNRVTGMGNGTARTDAASVAQAQDSTLLWGGTAAGTANARTISLTPAITSYTAGRRIAFINGAAANADGAFTLNVNSVGARSVTLPDGATNPPGGLIASGALVEVIDDGTRFLLLRPAATGWVLIGSTDIVAGATADFTGLGTGYGAYRLHVISAQPVTDDVQLWLRVGTGATPTWQSGASAYDAAGRQIVSTGGADFGGVGAQIALTQSGAGNGVGNSTGEVANLVIEFNNPDGTLFYPSFSWDGGFTRSDGRAISVNGSGFYGSAGAITAVRVMFSSGNIGVGTFDLYGMVK